MLRKCNFLNEFSKRARIYTIKWLQPNKREYHNVCLGIMMVLPEISKTLMCNGIKAGNDASLLFLLIKETRKQAVCAGEVPTEIHNTKSHCLCYCLYAQHAKASHRNSKTHSAFLNFWQSHVFLPVRPPALYTYVLVNYTSFRFNI